MIDKDTRLVLSDMKQLDISHQDWLVKQFNQINHLISELCFNGLFFFSEVYNYTVGYLNEKIVFLGKDRMGDFIISPFATLEKNEIISIFQCNLYLKIVSEKQKHEIAKKLLRYPYKLLAIVDDFDYMYKRKNLELLLGKQYHKKRNHINMFLKMYPDHRSETITSNNLLYVKKVLDKWEAKYQSIQNQNDNDYFAITKALKFYDVLNLVGRITYVKEEPVGFVIGELRKDGVCCIIHFEKGDDTIKGIYQFIDQDFVRNLPPVCRVINKEQDLGSLGLRQSKETYRPSAYLRKYRICKHE